MQIYEIWHFDDVSRYDPTTKTGGLFTNYVNTFLKLKQEASGWPEWCKTEDDKRTYIDFYYQKEGIRLEYKNIKQEGHDGPEIAHLSLLTKHAPSSFPVTWFYIRHYPSSNTFEISIRQTFWPSFMSIGLKMWPLQCTKGFSKISSSDLILDLTITHYQTLLRHHQNKHSDQV